MKYLNPFTMYLMDILQPIYSLIRIQQISVRTTKALPFWSSFPASFQELFEVCLESFSIVLNLLQIVF